MKTNITLSILNVILSILLYHQESYKIAMFNTFGAGFCAAFAYAIHKSKQP